jgi:hypothetical protein
MIVSQLITGWKKEFRARQFNMRARKIEALNHQVKEARMIQAQKQEIEKLESEKKTLNPGPLRVIGARIITNLERNAEAQPNRIHPDNFADYVRDERKKSSEEVNPWIRKE